MKQTQAHQVKKTKCFAYHVQEYHLKYLIEIIYKYFTVPLKWEAVKFIFLVRLCRIERGAPRVLWLAVITHWQAAMLALQAVKSIYRQ